MYLLSFAQRPTLMAVPGADRRKSVDVLRTRGIDSTLRLSKSDDLFPASEFGNPTGVDRFGAARVRQFIDDTGKREFQVLNELAETDDGFALEPPAIEVVTGRSAVADQSDRTSNRYSEPGGRFGETGVYFHYLEPTSGVQHTVIGE